MEAMLTRSTDAPVPLGEYVPEADERIMLRGLDWAAYQTLLALRGERRRPRIAYLDGVVELMGPSRSHEFFKSSLGRLLEAWCTEHGIPWTPYGSWHLDDESEEAGLEPDECYIFGPDPKAIDLPQLAVEVVWTSGGINKLEIFRRLGIQEVWFWKRDVISVYVLGPTGYQEREGSAHLPGIDLELLCRLAGVTPVSEAIAELQRAVRDKR